MKACLQGANSAQVAALLQRLRAISGTEGKTFRLLAWLCWHVLHFAVTVISIIVKAIHSLKCLLFTISKESYKASQIKKPKRVGIVIENRELEAQLSTVCKLIQWLADIGVKHVSLYDMEGLLKHSNQVLGKLLAYQNPMSQLIGLSKKHGEHVYEYRLTEKAEMTVELLSLCDGKEAIAKAARFLIEDILHKSNLKGQHIDFKLKEADIDRALEATGCSGPDPDLVLVFGSARCLLGFPAWRLRFTEIMYMGMLRSLSLGSLLNAFSQFSTKNQRYGK